MTASGDSHDLRTTVFMMTVPMRLKLYERQAALNLHHPPCLTCHFPHTDLSEWQELKTCQGKKKPGWHFPGANEEKPKSTSRDVIWFLAGCRAMSQVVLEDESGEEDHFPRVNSTTGSSGYHPENSRGVEKQRKKKMTRQTVQRPCCRVYFRRESSNRIKHATVQRQYLNQVQAKSNRAPTECSAGYHLSHLESCCYFHLGGQFSPAAEVVFEATTAIEIKGVAMASRAWVPGGKRGRIRYIRMPETKIVKIFPHSPFLAGVVDGAVAW